MSVVLADLVVQGGLRTAPFGSQLKASEYIAGGVPVVMPRDIQAGRVDDASTAQVTEEKAKSLCRHILLPGDLLFARRGDLTKIAIVEEHQAGWLCGTGCLRARLNQGEADPRFLRHYLATPRMVHWLASRALGQTMLNLNTQVVGALPIDLPPLDEQRRIAAILSTWDQAIERTERLAVAKQRELVGFVRHAAERYASPGIHLGQLCEILRGSSLSKREVNAQGRFPCILYGELHTAYGEVADAVLSRTDEHQGLSSREGDVLVPSASETAKDIGVATVVPCDGVLIGSDINVLRARRAGQYEPEYLAYYLTHVRRHEVARLAQGNAVVHLYGRDLAHLDVGLPSFEQQTRMVAAFRQGQKELSVLKAIAARYRAQRESIARALIAGAADLAGTQRMEPSTSLGDGGCSE